MELTDKEKLMMTEGLIFSTSKPIPAFVKEGLDGGNYICQANAGEDAIDLCIFDLSLPAKNQNIIVDVKPIDHIKIESWYT